MRLWVIINIFGYNFFYVTFVIDICVLYKFFLSKICDTIKIAELMWSEEKSF